MFNIWKEFSVSFSSCKQERKWQFLFSWFSNFTQYSFWISKLPVDRPNSFTRNSQHLIVYTHLNVLFDQKIYNSMVVELENHFICETPLKWLLSRDLWRHSTSDDLLFDPLCQLPVIQNVTLCHLNLGPKNSNVILIEFIITCT